MSRIKLPYFSMLAVTLLSAPAALAHPGHLPMQEGVAHEIHSAEHLIWWCAIGVAVAGLSCTARVMRRRVQAAKLSVDATRNSA